MRRSLLFVSVLAATAAVSAACGPTKNEPVKPPASPTPVVVASPAPSPIGSPGKPGASPMPKKTGSDPVKDAKPLPPITPNAQNPKR
jgi:hypothetical protein